MTEPDTQRLARPTPAAGVHGVPDLSGVAALGADLDLTLIDTRKATAVALEQVNATCGAAVDIEAFLARLGLPIRDELARWIPVERVEDAVQVFRAAFLADGLSHLTPLPGAVELADQLATAGRRLIVITSRIPRIAHACLQACDLAAGAVVGGVTGEQKARPMTEHQVAAYIGDHPLDMHGATVAGVLGIGVTTGAHTGGDLHRAGASWVVSSLHDVAKALT